MKALAIAGIVLASVALAGCTSSASPTPSPSSHTLDDASLGDSYHVEGGSPFVQGSRDMCDLEPLESILIEDEKSVNSYQGNTSVTSMTLSGGQLTYSTIWPHDIVGTGITEGSGTYTINADSAGRPVSITGKATITWHDQATNATSKKTDDIRLTLKKIPRPDYCG